jgi:hypothetical protein
MNKAAIKLVCYPDGSESAPRKKKKKIFFAVEKNPSSNVGKGDTLPEVILVIGADHGIFRF